MADEAYKWKIVLADDTVKEEDKDKFDLAWEEPKAVKSIELIGAKRFSCNLETGEFETDGEKSIPEGVDGPKKLFFRKRRQVRTDGKDILGARTKYLFGYTVNGKLHMSSIQPAIGMMPEEIINPGEVKTEKAGNFKDELVALKGIGAKTADQIIKLANNKEELAKIPREDLIEALRDDIVELLDEYLGRKE